MPWHRPGLTRNTAPAEDPASQLRIIRTHIAAQASHLSTINVQLGELTTMRMLLDQMLTNQTAAAAAHTATLDRITEQLAGVEVLIRQDDPA